MMESETSVGFPLFLYTFPCFPFFFSWASHDPFICRSLKLRIVFADTMNLWPFHSPMTCVEDLFFDFFFFPFLTIVVVSFAFFVFPASAALVFESVVPDAFRPFAFWNFFNADSVASPKTPSIFPE